jgi:type IV pilus assembly protein PilO
MTYADEEFILADGQEETPDYPKAFGITFTPRVGGIVIGVLGLLGATYLLVNAVQPSWQRYQELEASVENKEQQIQQKQKIQQQIRETTAKLEQAKQENQQVLSLFANEKTLDTLLLDLNSFVKDRRGSLTNYEPAQEAEAVVNDGSYGAAVNGKLKRKTIDVQLQGTFDQVQSIMRSFERLQALLIVKNFKAEVSEPQPLLLNQGRAVPGARPTIEATFTLDALSPVTEDEAQEAAAQPAAAQPAKK